MFFSGTFYKTFAQSISGFAFFNTLKYYYPQWNIVIAASLLQAMGQTQLKWDGCNVSICMCVWVLYATCSYLFSPTTKSHRLHPIRRDKDIHGTLRMTVTKSPEELWNEIGNNQRKSWNRNDEEICCRTNSLFLFFFIIYNSRL